MTYYPDDSALERYDDIECPNCGSYSVDYGFYSWECEECGHEWSDEILDDRD